MEKVHSFDSISWESKRTSQAQKIKFSVSLNDSGFKAREEKVRTNNEAKESRYDNLDQMIKSWRWKETERT